MFAEKMKFKDFLYELKTIYPIEREGGGGGLSWNCYFTKYSILSLFSMLNKHSISWKLFWNYFPK